MADLRFASGEASLSVRDFVIDGALSEPFQAVITARSPDEDLDLEALAGRPAALRILRREREILSPVLTWSGIVRSVAQVRVEDAETGLSTYEIVLVPSLWLLSQRTNNRLFQHIAIPDIVTRVLAEHGISADWRVDREAYPKLELRVQYGETDLTFVSRLLEEAGIAYFFEQDANDGSRLVFADSPHTADARPGVLPFVDETFQARAAFAEYVTKVRIGHDVRPGRHTIRDFDFRRPRYPLFSQHGPAAAPEDRLEQYQYLPGSFLHEHGPHDVRGPAGQSSTPVADDKGTARFEEQHGTRLARVQQEARRASKRHLAFQTSAHDLLPGVVFVVADHPRDDVTGKPLLVARSCVTGEVGGDFWTTGEAVFCDVPYRPPVRTPRPRIFGVQSAVVVGPSNEEIYVDELGRVRVQFHWDRENRFDPDSSIWMRVSQGWAGLGWGMMVIPRIGQEVLVGFLDGDPDNPLVVGRVYNALTNVPYKLPDHKTVSTWKSDSSPGSGGYNEIKYEDKKGRELVYEQAERDRARLVKNDEVVVVHHDRSDFVEHDEVRSVRHDRTRVVQHDEFVGIGQDRSMQVRRDEARAVGRDLTTYTGRNQMETTGESRLTQVGLDARAVVGNEDATKVGSRFVVTVLPGIGLQMGQGMTSALDGPAGSIVGPPRVTAGGPASGALAAIDHAVKESSMGETPMPANIAAPLKTAQPFVPGGVGDVRSLARSPLEAVAGETSGAPTQIEMVNRRIRLTTGQATITLDGPDIRIEAEGEISIVSKKQLLVRSTSGDLILRGGPNVLLNPNGPATGVTPEKGTVDREGAGDDGGAAPPEQGAEDADPAEGTFTGTFPALTEVDPQARSTLAQAFQTGLPLLLPNDASPDLGALRAAQLQMLENVLLGQPPFSGVGPVGPGPALPRWTSPAAHGAMLAERAGDLGTVGDFRGDFELILEYYLAAD